MGNIGSRVSELASVFGAEISYWSKNKKVELEEKNNIKFQEVQTIFSECDFISLHLAFNQETEQFVNKELIEKIKKGAILVNTAPNELVDLEALKKRLGNNDMTYIMDHSDELSADQAKKLSKHKNCIIYPPIGYTTKEASKEKQEIFVGNIRNFLKGETTNKVN
ncbi:MAG: hypothetical protein KAI57_04120 [Candidatus Pacebacteria bacterium]|nr:hypothetical protein [Candidatus Paceibacterota bacterium]